MEKLLYHFQQNFQFNDSKSVTCKNKYHDLIIHKGFGESNHMTFYFIQQGFSLRFKFLIYLHIFLYVDFDHMTLIVFKYLYNTFSKK